MKIKDISFLEKHTEKIVLALAVVFLGAVVAVYVLGGQVRVKVDNRDVAAHDVESVLANEAQRLAQKLDGASDLRISTPDVESRFNEALKRDATPGEGAFAALGGPGGLDLAGGIPTIGVLPYRLVTVPAPTDVMARAGQGSLDPATLSQAPGIAQVVGNRAPFDLGWVVVGAKFPISKLEEQLEAPSTDEIAEVPESWWSTRLELADVELWRQEKTATGWTEPVMIPAMPGQPTFRRYFKGNVITKANVSKLIDELRKQRTPLIRPQFYKLLAGSGGWGLPPLPGMATPTAPGPAESPALRALSEELQNLVEQYRAVQTRVDQYKKAGRQPPATFTRRLNDLQEKVRDVQRRIGEEQQKAGMAAGPAVAVGPAPPAATGGISDDFLNEPDNILGDPNAPIGEPKRIVRLWDERDPIIWANDVDVQPGTTYRYRMRVIWTNPLFARTLDKQPEEAKKLLIKGAWSDWTEPVTTPRHSYYFLVQDNRRNNTGRVEVWRFHGGQWQTAQFDVEPGDRIGGDATPRPLQAQAAGPTNTVPPSPINFDTGLIAVDLDFDYTVSVNHPKTSTRMICVDGDEMVDLVRADDMARANELRAELTKPVLEVDPSLFRDIGTGESFGPNVFEGEYPEEFGPGVPRGREWAP